jgi:FAD/FMN-containing dehydrogenase
MSVNKMNPYNLDISGDWHTDPAVLDRFSRDMSAYRILPALVVEPKNDEDILRTLQFARNEGLGIVSRSGGSDLSGASIGPGIVLNFKKYLNRAVRLDEEAVVEPGMILDEFIRKISAQNLMLPAVPSSSALCALGGNVGTRATGPRTAKYGTLDAFVTSLRFITAGGQVVDTAQSLPDDLETGLRWIQKRFLDDASSRAIVDRRPFIAGGYNLKAFARYTDMRELAAHLLVGSIGTLGIITEIRLKLIGHKPSGGTLVAHFRDYDDLAEAAIHMKALDPAALEYSDASCAGHINGKIINLEDPATIGTMIAEFDASVEQVQEGRQILEKYNISRLWMIDSGSEEEAALWQDRRRTQPSLLKYCRQKSLLLTPIIDDIAIHLKDFGPVIKELGDLMQRLGHEISVYGHLGFGSIHARPYFDPAKRGLEEQIETVSRETFKILHKYNGTLVGEHNAGRSRSVYLKNELGPAYNYLRDIKKLFDPDDILNPGSLFDTAPICTHMELKVR